MRNLFLDDIRQPEAVGDYYLPKEDRMQYYSEPWEVVRNYREFVEWVESNGVPDKVSFDHDLAAIHYEGGVESFSYEEETGYDCAKWLKDYCEEMRIPFPEWYVHSMNPVGKENIVNLLKCM